MFCRYQILQARLSGADTVLLIVAMLNDDDLLDLVVYSRGLGMEPLVEVASVEEVKRATKVDAKVIGVNNRDLNTFVVDMGRTTSLSALVSSDVILLALSGITGRSEVEEYVKAGARGVLVGEAIMKSPDCVEAIRNLRGISTEVNGDVSSNNSAVKICGLTNLKDARQALKAGARFLGFIFAKESPRYVAPTVVKQITDDLGLHVTSIPTAPVDPAPTSANKWFGGLKGKGVQYVGVFTDQTPHEINEIATICGLDLIQLHLPRPSSFHRLLNRPIIQVIGVSGDTGIEGIKMEIEKCVGSVQYILLDTTTKDLVGGTGKVFDWELVSNVGCSVWMAGGLTAENVADARRTGAIVFDVSSGVEAEKGFKDHEKVDRFILNAVK